MEGSIRLSRYQRREFLVFQLLLNALEFTFISIKTLLIFFSVDIPIFLLLLLLEFESYLQLFLRLRGRFSFRLVYLEWPACNHHATSMTLVFGTEHQVDWNRTTHTLFRLPIAINSRPTSKKSRDNEEENKQKRSMNEYQRIACTMAEGCKRLVKIMFGYMAPTSKW